MKLRIISIIFIFFILSGCEGEQIPHCLESSFCDFQFYPNPLESEGTIDFMSNSSDIVRLSVISINGQLLQEDQIEVIQGRNNFTRSFDELGSGVYVLSLEFKNEIHNLKIVKK